MWLGTCINGPKLLKGDKFLLVMLYDIHICKLDLVKIVTIRHKSNIRNRVFNYFAKH